MASACPDSTVQRLVEHLLRGAHRSPRSPTRASHDALLVLSDRGTLTGGAVDVTVRISREGDVEVTIGDEGGYTPDVIDDLARRAREQAVAVHLQLHTPAKT